MERVDIKVGFNCNNHCVFCVQGRKRETLPSKSKKEVVNSLQEAFAAGKREVVFTGGEPSLHTNFLELIAAAKKIGFEEIQIQSNGRIFAYPDFCVRAIRAGATQFGPSLHGHNAKIHDSLTAAKGSFEQTTRGIKNLKKLNQFVLTNSVITSSNYKFLPELAKVLVDLGVDQFQFAFVHILGSAKENEKWLVPKKSEIMPYLKKGLEIGLKAGKRVTAEAVPFCFLRGYEQCVAEDIMPKTSIYDSNFTVADYGDYRRNSGKEKAAKCRSCKYFSRCEGPWKEYPAIFGWSEFKPVKK